MMTFTAPTIHLNGSSKESAQQGREMEEIFGPEPKIDHLAKKLSDTLKKAEEDGTSFVYVLDSMDGVSEAVANQ